MTLPGVPHCTVVIPTKNPMPRFKAVLDAVLAQRTPWPFDVIVIDSGSRDGTVEFARSRPGVRVISIPPAEFGHGRTRNRAIAATQAPFVALITHDAQPVDETWLANLVAAVEQDDAIAGAFGRHMAWPRSNAFLRRDMDRHFAGFLAHPAVVDRELDPERYARDEGWRQFLHFYSDNNSCLRRSVWQRHPYPDVDFAEDQLWAREIIHLGYRKAYAHDAVVYHAHEYGAFERLQRSFDEARSFKLHFGYNLCRDTRSALRSFLGLSYQDLRFAFRRNTGFAALLRLPSQIVQNLMLVLGHALGTNYARVPARWQQRLSRDHRLFVGGPARPAPGRA